jgi:hypothetical protein
MLFSRLRTNIPHLSPLASVICIHFKAKVPDAPEGLCDDKKQDLPDFDAISRTPDILQHAIHAPQDGEELDENAAFRLHVVVARWSVIQ